MSICTTHILQQRHTMAGPDKVLLLPMLLPPQLRELLEGPFKTLDCFKKEQARREAEVRTGREAVSVAGQPCRPRPGGCTGWSRWCPCARPCCCSLPGGGGRWQQSCVKDSSHQRWGQGARGQGGATGCCSRTVASSGVPAARSAASQHWGACTAGHCAPYSGPQLSALFDHAPLCTVSACGDRMFV
jgi:hypothetical protein